MGDVGRPLRRIGVVVGLPQEAVLLRRILWHAPLEVVSSGAKPHLAEQGAVDLIARGAEVLLSFGFAGGLDPDLRPGDVVIADAVIAPDGTRYATESELCARLSKSLKAERCRWHVGLLAGSDQVLNSVEAKRRLASRTSAIAVDMESHAVAKGAAGRSFAALRVVVDPAEHVIPTSVVAALQPDGRIRALALIGGMVRRPSELWPLLVLARDNAAAGAGLGRAALALERAFDLVQ